MSRELKKFCNLAQIIKKHDAKSGKDGAFYQALDDLCTLPLLRPGISGITFLYPESKEVREKIIDATYSDSPEVAVAMVKAIILQGFYPKVSDLKGQTIRNRLNQGVNVDNEGKWGDFVIKDQTKFKFYDHNSKISMLLLEGNGDISTKGEFMEFTRSSRDERNRTVVGGSVCRCNISGSHRITIAKKIAKQYKNERNKKSNIYVKKVCAQMAILKSEVPELYNSSKLTDHLGNEEISDSYLLDMITPEHVFCKLYQAMGGSSESFHELAEDTRDGKTYYELYLQIKGDRIKSGMYKDDAAIGVALKKNINEQNQLISGIVAVCDIRDALNNAYRDKRRLGKDLFIVFTSVMKEMWEHEFDMASFENYTYMATHIYTTPESMVNQDFNQFKDATLHGNLIKSDVFKFIPWVTPKVYVDAGYTDGIYPRPIDLKIYSLNSLVSGITTKKTGGGRSILDEYFSA